MNYVVVDGFVVHPITYVCLYYQKSAGTYY